MRKAIVLYKETEAGLLTQHEDGSYTFQYKGLWVDNDSMPSISLTLPKRHEEYKSDHLFPFFYNLLPEGTNKRMVCKQHKIDYEDYFSLLMITARIDTIGAVKVSQISNK